MSRPNSPSTIILTLYSFNTYLFSNCFKPHIKRSKPANDTCCNNRRIRAKRNNESKQGTQYASIRGVYSALDDQLMDFSLDWAKQQISIIINADIIGKQCRCLRNVFGKQNATLQMHDVASTLSLINVYLIHNLIQRKHFPVTPRNR